MDLSHERARYYSEKGKEYLANLDPEMAKEEAEIFFIKAYLLPPNQLELATKADLVINDQERRIEIAEDIGRSLENIAMQYYDALDPKSREEVAILGCERLKKAGMQTLWDSRYKHKSHTDSA